MVFAFLFIILISIYRGPEKVYNDVANQNSEKWIAELADRQAARSHQATLLRQSWDEDAERRKGEAL